MLPSHPPLAVTLTVEQLWQRVPGGSGTYIRELATQLVDRDDVEATGLRARGRSQDRHGLPASLPLVSSSLPRPALYEAWSRFRRPAAPWDGRRPDVIHATTWAVPRRSAPLVVTVHDLAFVRSPEHFTPRGVAFFTRALAIVRKEADVVISPSIATLDDCVQAGIERERVHVIPHGVTARAVTEHERAEFRERHALTREFVLWVGTFEPRKNLTALLAAYGRMASLGTELDLVLVGPPGWGDTADEVRLVLEALPPDRVHVLGRLSADDLQAAYSAARVFCFPSLWEGFGMPVLEAMAHGTPVVTSSDTSMAEIVGDGAILVPATDTDALAHALEMAAGPSHDHLARAAVANAAIYTWSRTADLTVAAYRAARDGAAR